MRAMQFGDLNAEQRNTVGALDQYRLAGMYVTTLDEREPCRQPSARQGGGFDVAQCVGARTSHSCGTATYSARTPG